MGYDQGKIDNWAADAENGQMYKDTLNEIAGAVRNMTVDYENLDSAMEEENNNAEEAKTSILSTVTSIKDLKNEITSNDILGEEDYGKGLSLLALQYEECEDAYTNYVNAVETGNPYLIEQAKKLQKSLLEHRKSLNQEQKLQEIWLKHSVKARLLKMILMRMIVQRKKP